MSTFNVAEQRESPSAVTGNSLCLWITPREPPLEAKLDIFETWDINRLISDKRVCC